MEKKQTTKKTKKQKTPNYRTNQPYQEEYSKELINFRIKYSPVYLNGYNDFYNSMDQYIKTGETKNFRHYIQKPINSSFASAAEAAISVVDKETELPRKGKNTIIAITISVFVANQIYKIANQEKQADDLENCILSAISERLPLFKIFGAYANRAKNLIVITAIPYMYLPKKKNASSPKDTTSLGVPKKINYSRFILTNESRRLPQYIFEKIKELNFFDKLKQEEKKRDTTSWKMDRISRVAADEDISLQALGIYVKLILSKHQDLVRLQDEMGKKRSVNFRRARVELQSKGYVLMIRPKVRGDRWITKIN